MSRSRGPLFKASLAALIKLFRARRARRCLLQDLRLVKGRFSIADISKANCLAKHKILQGCPAYHEIVKAQKQFEITSQ